MNGRGAPIAGLRAGVSRAALAALIVVGGAGAASADAAADIAARLRQWTEDFNAGRKVEACELFSKELRSDFRGQGEADYATRCRLIERAIDNKAHQFRYEPRIKEIIVSGDLAVVRLDWLSTVLPLDITTVEPGMDVFRKEADGRWRIIRYLAYEEEGPVP